MSSPTPPPEPAPEPTPLPDDEPLKLHTPRTDEQLKQIARDIHAGHIFTSEHLRKPGQGYDVAWADEMLSVFMVLRLMSKTQMEYLDAVNPCLIYEYLSKAMPRSINGKPMFMSMNVVGEDEWPRLQKYLRALEQAPDPLGDI